MVFFDGEATQWIPELEADEDLLPHGVYTDVRKRGLVGGACGFCASFFEVDRAIEKVDVTVNSSSAEHGSDVAQLAEQSYQLLTVG